jgi:hypothetical protein
MKSKSNGSAKRKYKDSGFVWTTIIVTTLIIGLWGGTYFLLRGKDPVVRGTFGDMFGAVNALFSGLALAGIILTIVLQRKELKLQRIELGLQRSEMQETRREFLLNRTTQLVYSQLDRFEKALSEFKFQYNGNTYIGNDAISLLNEKEEPVYRPFDKPDEVYKEEMKKVIIKLLQLYTPNRSEIEKFAHTAYNAVSVLKRLLYKTELEVGQLNDLKNLFFVNVGFVNMNAIGRISEIAMLELEYLQPEDYVKYGLDVGELMRANIFLKSINEFYHLRLTKENFNEAKAKWEMSVGANNR